LCLYLRFWAQPCSMFRTMGTSDEAGRRFERREKTMWLVCGEKSGCDDQQTVHVYSCVTDGRRQQR
jgi:hypothetical protein